MDDRGWLAHCPTREQLEFFAEHGYLIVRDAVEPDLLRRLNESVDRVWSREREVQGLSAGDMLAKFRMVVEDEAFHELLDNPETFPLVWDILVWNVQLKAWLEEHRGEEYVASLDKASRN